MAKKGDSKKKGKSSLIGNFELEERLATFKGGIRVVAVRTLRRFWEEHAETEKPLRAWNDQVKKRSWTKPNDILNDFPKVRPIPNNRCIFKIAGNGYRLLIETHYNRGIVFILFIGTHTEYDKIEAATIQNIAMKPKILKTEEEYEIALKLVSDLMDAKPGSTAEEKLELCSMLVEQYEEARYPIPPPDPIEAIKFRMEQIPVSYGTPKKKTASEG